METVVLAICDDNVVHEMNAHDFASLLNAFGQLLVGTAWCQASGRMIVANGKNRCIR